MPFYLMGTYSAVADPPLGKMFISEPVSFAYFPYQTIYLGIILLCWLLATVILTRKKAAYFWSKLTLITLGCIMVGGFYFGINHWFSWMLPLQALLLALIIWRLIASPTWGMLLTIGGVLILFYGEQKVFRMTQFDPEILLTGLCTVIPLLFLRSLGHRRTLTWRTLTGLSLLPVVVACQIYLCFNNDYGYGRRFWDFFSSPETFFLAWWIPCLLIGFIPWARAVVTGAIHRRGDSP